MCVCVCVHVYVYVCVCVCEEEGVCVCVGGKGVCLFVCLLDYNLSVYFFWLLIC